MNLNMTIKEYLEIVSNRLQSGISREHSYRGDLETLIRQLVSGIEITNEPANVTDCGNPDYVITKGEIPVGYQPAQKWLKDRKERELKFEDILHYQKIIVALTETDRIMKEIDKIEIE